MNSDPEQQAPGSSFPETVSDSHASSDDQSSINEQRSRKSYWSIGAPSLAGLRRFRYSKIRDVYSSKGKQLVEHLNNMGSPDNIPLPFANKSYGPGEEWIKGVILCSWGTGLILVINIILTVIAAGMACSLTDGWKTGLHFLINFLSTGLLAASNYVMQCLCAPSRASIDRAHAKKRWLDIGTLSLRNFTEMDTRRKVLWVILLLSSLPIHMLYNSAVFSSVTSVRVGRITIPEDLTPDQPLVDEKSARAFQNHTGFNAADIHRDLFNGALQNISLSACNHIDEFNTDIGLVIFVTSGNFTYPSSGAGNTSSIEAREYRYTGSRRLGGLWDETDEIRVTPVPWMFPVWAFRDPSFTFDGWQDYAAFDERHRGYSHPWVYPSHCLVKPIKGDCELYFNLPICLAVIACNIVKLICMCLAGKSRHREILLTVGDALASFLDYPDVTTKDKCLMSRMDFANHSVQTSHPIHRTVAASSSNPLIILRAEQQMPESAYSRIRPRKKRWSHAVSRCEWNVTIAFFLTCLAVTISLFLAGSRHIYYPYIPFEVVIKAGIGKPSSSRLIDGLNNTSITALILIANTPQLVFSSFYYLCNSILSSMLAAAEYNDFSLRRKPLRVSWPRGLQRSTYYLSIPWRYSVPLLAISVTLHWLLSQAIFPVIIQPRDPHNNKTGGETQSCGYSVFPVFLTLIIGTVPVVVLGGLAMRPLRSHMPLAGSCSLAIAAACHPPEDDSEASLKPVMWGEVCNEAGPRYAHCTFTSKAVVPPSLSCFYR
ncbi:hypothetical protein BJX61DRAFT_531845 [Aspergillus egyptiacus]|nr:hypothetical protein BJX61DRAFT_531845 [Aspergillus egyptiacus]